MKKEQQIEIENMKREFSLEIGQPYVIEKDSLVRHLTDVRFYNGACVAVFEYATQEKMGRTLLVRSGGLRKYNFTHYPDGIKVVGESVWRAGKKLLNNN